MQSLLLIYYIIIIFGHRFQERLKDFQHLYITPVQFKPSLFHIQKQAKPQRTCAEEAVLVVEGIHTSTVANERGCLKGLLILQLHHAQFSLQVDPLPVCCILNRLINPPAQLPTHTLPHFCTRAYHLQRDGHLLEPLNTLSIQEVQKVSLFVSLHYFTLNKLSVKLYH